MILENLEYDIEAEIRCAIKGIMTTERHQKNICFPISRDFNE